MLFTIQQEFHLLPDSLIAVRVTRFSVRVDAFVKDEAICDPPQDFNAKGESTRTTHFHFKTKEFILTRFSTLAILPH